MDNEAMKVFRAEMLELGLMLQDMQKEVHPEHPIDEKFNAEVEELRKQVDADKL